MGGGGGLVWCSRPLDWTAHARMLYKGLVSFTACICAVLPKTGACAMLETPYPFIFSKGSATPD